MYNQEKDQRYQDSNILSRNEWSSSSLKLTLLTLPWLLLCLTPVIQEALFLPSLALAESAGEGTEGEDATLEGFPFPVSSRIGAPMVRKVLTASNPPLTEEKRAELIKFQNALKRRRKELRPSELSLYHHLHAKIFFTLGSKKEAQESALRSLSYRAKNSDMLHIVGITALETGQFEVAERYLQEALWFTFYAHFSPADSWLGLAQVYKNTDQQEKLIVALENGSRGKISSGGSLDALQLAQSKIEVNDIAGAKRVLTALKTNNEADELKRVVLLAQTNLLSLTPNTSRKVFADSASSIEKKLGEVPQSDLSPESLALSHEVLVRCWLASNNLDKAAESLRTAQPILGSSHTLNELNSQLRLQRASS